jgi:hypothetical protein
MKLSGTIDEWLKYKPDAMLTHDSILPNGVAIINFKKHEKPQSYYYHSPTPDGPPKLYLGACCPYVCKGLFQYEIGFVTIFGSGSSYVLSDSQANDSRWYEINKLEDLLK